jgi:hypothetical protein
MTRRVVAGSFERCGRNHRAIRENIGKEFLGNLGIARSLNARGVATARGGQWTARCKLARSNGVLSLIYVPTEANIPILEARSHFRNNPKGGGNPPPVHRLEPVIAVDFGLVDEYPYFHIGQKIFSPVDRQSGIVPHNGSLLRLRLLRLRITAPTPRVSSYFSVLI